MIVAGQVHGGIAQGHRSGDGWNTRIYDPQSGQLVTGSLHGLLHAPRRRTLPSFNLGFTKTVCPSNPLGMKGCGEADAIASPPAIINAVTDALGIRDIEMPATPARVWAAIKSRPRAAAE